MVGLRPDYDPTCGSGGLLLHVREEALRPHGHRRAFSLVGQELTPTAWAIGPIRRTDTTRLRNSDIVGLARLLPSGTPLRIGRLKTR